MTSSNLRDFGVRYAEAWCSQDPAKVASFFAPDGSLTINSGAPSVGREQIAAAAASFMRDFPDMRIAMDGIVESHPSKSSQGGAPNIEFHWTLTGTHAATGRRVRISGYEEWLFGDDGLVSASIGHFDAADYARQVG